MLRRAARYSLLILTVLLAGVWVDSYWNCRTFRYSELTHGFAIAFNYGRIHGSWWDEPRAIRTQETEIGFTYKSQPTAQDYFPKKTDVEAELLGFAVSDQSKQYSRTWRSKWVTIPLWMLFTPPLLLTCWLWYRPMRNRLQKRSTTGFEVQPAPGASDAVADGKTS